MIFVEQSPRNPFQSDSNPMENCDHCVTNFTELDSIKTEQGGE